MAASQGNFLCKGIVSKKAVLGQKKKGGGEGFVKEKR